MLLCDVPVLMKEIIIKTLNIVSQFVNQRAYNSKITLYIFKHRNQTHSLIDLTCKKYATYSHNSGKTHLLLYIYIFICNYKTKTK